MDDRRDQLIRQLQETVREQQEVIVRQNSLIEQLQSKVGLLERRIGQMESGKGKPKGMPGNKLETVPPPQAKGSRKQRERAYVRRRGVPTHRVVHAVGECPGCRMRLSHGRIKRTREVIEVPQVQATITEHVFMERQCPGCGKRSVPTKDVLRGVAVGKSRIGVGLHSLIAALREMGRLPIDTIRWYLHTLHGLSLSRGEIVNVLNRVATRAHGVLAGIQGAVRASPWISADETGWRQDGHNGYVWTFSTPQERYYIRAGRDKGVVERELVGFAGTLVSDFYAAYNVYLGEHQRCWPHLLRDIHELTELHPEHQELGAWAREVHSVYERAKLYAGLETQDDQRRRTMRLHFERRLLAVCTPYLREKQAVQHTLCKRIERHIKELFAFVAKPGVPPDNNGAERSLRHLVTARKISGGTRSESGTATRLTLASVFGTWQAQHRDPLTECRNLLSIAQP
ncbi:MAG: IS66 family transposase [Chloroflexota bacterium]|nr:IS66 family transposase [Chloroflexota bacterium]